MTYLGTLSGELKLCQYSKAGNLLPGQPGCYNLFPVFQWIKRCIISIALVFLISFLPLLLQGESQSPRMFGAEADDTSQSWPNVVPQGLWRV